MEPKKFAFSPLQPILFLIAAPAIYYWFLNHFKTLFLTHDRFTVLAILVFSIYVWNYFRITFLMLLRRPAILLTDKAIAITARNYTIAWEDVMDVYMARQGGGYRRNTSLNQYIIIRVREPEKYIKAIKNPFTRCFRWYTRNLFNLSPFEVSLFLVRGDDDEIYHTILNYYQHNRLYFRIPYTPE